MEFIEATPLPEVCQCCTEPDCDVCDHGLERWLLSLEKEYELWKKLREQGEKRTNRLHVRLD